MGGTASMIYALSPRLPKAPQGSAERVGSEIGASLLNASREYPLPGNSPGLAADPPKGGWRLLGWRRVTSDAAFEIQSDDKSSQSKVGGHDLLTLCPPSPLRNEGERGRG
jgi:hypothetical protein